MKIRIVTPRHASKSAGNQVTAERWAKLMRSLGHRVHVQNQYDAEPCDVLIALHAKRSAKAIAQFHRLNPDKPTILALTGTDLHRDIARFRTAQESVSLASHLVLLEPEGAKKLPRKHRRKVTVIYQSATAVTPRPAPDPELFEVCVSGHLRPVKDPLRTAMAVRKLPPASKLRVVHLGAALTDSLRRRATREAQRNPRYDWLGELPLTAAKRRMAKCRLLVLTSRIEGAPSVISEAVVAGVPIIAARITATVGLLGSDYPALFPVGDTARLRELLLLAENDRSFLRSLERACKKRKPLFSPAHEKQSWHELLRSLA